MNLKKIAKEAFEISEYRLNEDHLNENYGDVLNELVIAFQKASRLMKGSSISSREIYEDLGEKLGFKS